jgi:hypothetical protein
VALLDLLQESAIKTTLAAVWRRDMGHPRYSKEQIAARGQVIYEQQIRALVEPGQDGRFLIVDN